MLYVPPEQYLMNTSQRILYLVLKASTAISFLTKRANPITGIMQKKKKKKGLEDL